MNRVLFALLLVLVLLGTRPALAQAREPSPEHPTARAELLGQWLEAQARQQTVERRFTGGALLGIGTAGFAFGLTRLLQSSPKTELSKGGSIGLIAGGAFGLASGIFRLVVRSEAEEVRDRWERARESDVDDVLLARFEGEFHAAAQHARRIQRLTRWLGLATALSGVAVMVATPFANLDQGGRVAAYVGGGLLVLGGGINVGSSLATPPPLKAWEAYQRGEPPGPTSHRLFGVTPWFHRRGAGVFLAATIGHRRSPRGG